jgi:hypothetical protein
VIYTSYFSKYRGPNGVSIAGKTPAGFPGRECKKLAPKWWFYKKYKEDGDWDFYTEQYYKEVLSVLDPLELAKELGDEAVIICYETPEKECHRHLVADWLRAAGIDVQEIKL